MQGNWTILDMKNRFSIIILLVCGGFLFAGSQEQKLARWLKRYPNADANGDGRLTVEEAAAYRQKLRSEANSSGIQRGTPRQFKVDPGWESDRFPDAAVCYRSPDQIKSIYAKTLPRNQNPIISYEKPANGALRIVGTGHSFMGPGYKTLPVICRAAGFEQPLLLHTGGGITGSARYKWEQENGIFQFADKAKPKLLASISNAQWDAMTWGPYYNDRPAYYACWIEFCLKYNLHMKFYLSDAWPQLEGLGEIPTSEEALTAEAFVRLGNERNARTAELVGALNEKYPGKVFVMPTSDAMVLAVQHYHRGELPGIEGINRAVGGKERSLWRDRLGHLGPGLDRLEGYVFYATIYGRSPELISDHIPFGGSPDFPNRQLDRVFRKIAWEAVVGNSLSGVIDKNRNGIGDARERARPSSKLQSVTQDRLPQNKEAIAGVETERIETARASWWGFDPADATQSIQAAINSRAKRVIVEDMGRPWIVTPIRLPSNKEIVFEPGVVVEAKRGAFLGKNDCLFKASGRKNLVIRGTDAVFRMHKSDYHKPPYALAEWRHALSIRGCENVVIDGLTLVESGGDGIYLGVGSDRATNRNVTIRNVVCDGNNRQGISVITAENLLIENCIFRNTHGTAPQAGIDFEPNHSDERLVNCVLRNCRSENNGGHAYHIYLGHMNEHSPPISIRFENCTSKGCRRYSTYVGVANRMGERTVRGRIEYVDCHFEADGPVGVYVRGNEADGCRVRFERCQIVRRDEEATDLAPIMIEAPRRLDLDVGNIEIDDCIIRDKLVRRPVALIASPMTKLRNLTGSLTVESPNGKHSYTLNVAQLDEWFPSQGLIARIPRMPFDWRKTKPTATEGATAEKGTTFRLRGEATLLVWGETAQPIELVATLEPVGRQPTSEGTMKLTTLSGETTKLSPKTRDEHLVYRFTPQKTGPHRLHWQGDSKTTIRPVQTSTSIAMLGGPLGVNLIRPMGTLYFFVPAGVERFALQVAGQGAAETVKAVIHDASGRIVDQQDRIAAPHVFVLERDKIAPAEIWSVTLGKAAEGVLEDVSIQTLGAPPLFSGTPNGVLSSSLPN